MFKGFFAILSQNLLTRCYENPTLSCFRINLDTDERFLFDSGCVLHRSQVEVSFGPWMEEIVEFSRHLKSIDIDLTAFSCLAALAIVHGKTNTCMATHGSHFLESDNLCNG